MRNPGTIRHIIVQSIVVCFFLSFFACNSPERKARKVVREWMGKEIILPEKEKVVFKILGRDTLCSGLWDKPFKVFVYIDSIGCTSCRMGLSQWKEIIDNSKVEYPDLGFLFVIHSNNYRKFERELKDAEFDFPVIYDHHNTFFKLNHFAPNPYRTFLLDKQNKVQLIGSPVTNTRMWALYEKVLQQSGK